MKVDGGVYFQELSINFSFRLPDYYNFFQTEVVTIKVAVDLLLQSAAFFKELTMNVLFDETSMGASPQRNRR